MMHRGRNNGSMAKVTVVTCGPAVNESERKAIVQLKTRLISAQPDGEWLLLTNLPFSATHRLQSDEIDVLAIGPPGVRVVEVKHWGGAWVRRNAVLVEQEADRVTAKARKVGTTLRRQFADVGRVEGVFLLTESSARVKGIEGPVRGVPFHTLKTWQDALGFSSPSILSTHQVRALGNALTPASHLATEGNLKRLGGYVRLELQTTPEERFHRVFKATHSSRQDRVILHLYDWSASDDAKVEEKARREFDTLHRLQQYGWAPRIVDSFQPVPGYPGEIHFFTVADPAAPSVEERANDGSWSAKARLAFARSAICALEQLHESGTKDGVPMLHRNLTPATVLVKHDNSPILTGFDYARIPADITIASVAPEDWHPATAPEVCAQGLAAADRRSDVYSMCASLIKLFERTNEQVATLLARGMADEPSARADLPDLSQSLARLLGETLPAPTAPPVRFWTEDQEVSFEGHRYRIVSRLGSGGIGSTFKVVELDPKTGEDLGAYVAKAVHNGKDAEPVMRAYRLVRPHLSHPALSTIYQVASEWRDNEFSALMIWIEGEPLGEYAGLLPILAEDFQEASDEALAIRWLRATAEALETLHRNGLVHGDVSPRNMILCGSDIVLTDYDCVTKIGEKGLTLGTVMYCSPSFVEGVATTPSDDIYALAASFFHVWFERPPFQYDDIQAKDRGLNWADIDRGAYPVLAPFLDRATNPRRDERYGTVAEAMADLAGRSSAHAQPTDADAIVAESADQSAANPDRTAAKEGGHANVRSLEEARRENRVPWLKSLLQSYPGSRWGNSETRGLDTDFAEATYVETKLEQALRQDIVERRVSLVVLCGNAGDGKTALLQHLAKRLDLGSHKSATRILEGRLADGLTVRMNLDGSASWQGRSANELLDECLGPFHDGPAQSSALLLAINDGRLLEWIEDTEEKAGETRLTNALREQLEGNAPAHESHIRFVNLNHRSLVGSVAEDGKSFDTSFLDRMVDSLYGGDRAEETWRPCQSCSAQNGCQVYRATRFFGPATIPGEDDDVRSRARERLFDALQAVHLRGETHITVRELRAALVYILFGTQYCDEYHQGDESETYADRAFSPQSAARQGEVLADLVRYDPGLEAHPKIDRYLLQSTKEDESSIRRYPELTLKSARRHAYFEWAAGDLERIAGDKEGLGLAQGRDLRLFRNLAIHTGARRRADMARRLCAGISRLESLPPQALDRQGAVPLRIMPRTPTETAFWVEKPLANFHLELDEPTTGQEMEQLHREAFLIYRYKNGRVEKLRLGADLLHLLLELSRGLQIGDVSTDDTFAQLSIFVQRLVREDHRQAVAWNPMREDAIFDIAAVSATAEAEIQHLTIREINGDTRT